MPTNNTGQITIYTIGHSHLLISKLINILKQFDIKVLVDVRSSPHSQFSPQFDRETLKFALENAGFEYKYAGDYLGGRPKDPACYKNGQIPEGKTDYLHLVDYPFVMTKDWFIKGVNHLIKIAEKDRTVIMCSEENPAQCHRHHLIGKYLMKKGITVLHIRGDGKTIGSKQISDIIEEPPTEQLDLFKKAPVKIYTIGFTKKSARKFFEILRTNKIQCLVDIRLHPDGQLAGFTKKEDLRYFLAELIECEYRYMPSLAPTDDILKAYRKDHDWQKYEQAFETLMVQRGVPETLGRTLFEDKVCCLLCSEDTAEKCHRRLVAERLKREWSEIQIIHL